MSLALNQLNILLTSNNDASLQDMLAFLCVNKENPEGEKSVITGINNILANGKTRFRGLELLKELIPYCSPEVLGENLLHWSGFCVIHHVEDRDKEFKLNVLTKLLENADGVDTFHKKFLAEHLNATLKACLVCQYNEERIASLKCLTQCMKLYQSWFGNHKQKIETYLIDCLDSSCEAVAEAAAFGFIHFLQTGGAGNNGVNYSNNFSSEFRKICATIQSLLNSFFSNFPEIKTSLEIDNEIIKFCHPLKDTSHVGNDLAGISTRIINCLIFLRAMLVKPFSAEKRIVIKHVIDIIYRGLSAHICFSEIHVLRSTNHSIALKRIELHLLRILRALIKGFRANIIPFSVIFENCMLNTLRRIHLCTCFSSDLSYKLSVYKTLIIWFTLNKIINEAQFLEKIIPIVLMDISLTRKTVLLNVKDTPTNQKNSLPQLNRNGRYSLSYVAENTCIYALKTLKCLLTTSVSTGPVLLKEILSTILTILSDIQLGKIVPPYNNEACQAKLYEVLVILFKKDAKVLPSLHLMIGLLNVGLNGQNGKISQTCKEGLEFLEKISHPICSTLYISEMSSSLIAPVRHNDLVDNTYELSRSNENNSKKDINIISNILIAPKLDSQLESEDDVIMIEDSDQVEGSISPRSTETSTVCQQSKHSSEDLKLTSCNNENSPRKSIKELSVSFHEESENKGKNGRRSSISVEEADLESNFEDMFDSFQDVVAE